MATRHELLQQAEQKYDAFRDALAGLDDAEMSRQWLGTWGVREIVAHIVGWQIAILPALERLARGEASGMEGAFDDLDGANARFVGERAGSTPSELLAELAASQRAVLSAATQLPEQQFSEGGPAAELLAGVADIHYRAHAAQIRDWRQLRALNAQFIHNFISNDVPAHDRLTHRDFVCITARGAREEKAAYLRRWATGFDADAIPYWDTRDELISLFGSIALVRSVNKYVVVRNGEETTGMTGYTDTYIKEGGAWTCIQAQLTEVAPEHYPADATIVQRYLRGVPQHKPLPARA